MNTYADKFLEKALKGLSPTTTLFTAPDGTYVLLENQEARVVSQDDIDTIIDDILIYKHYARGIQEGCF